MPSCASKLEGPPNDGVDISRADRINHALFREVAPSGAERRRAALTRRKTMPRELHGQPLTRVSRTERDDDGAAQAARSDTSARYARAVYHGGRGIYRGGRMGSRRRPALRHPPGFCARCRRREIGLYAPRCEAFFSLPQRSANSRHVRVATPPWFRARMGQAGTLTTLHFCGTDRSIRHCLQLYGRQITSYSK